MSYCENPLDLRLIAERGKRRKHPLWPTEVATFFPLFSSFLLRKLVSLSLVASRRSTKLHDNKETRNVDKDVFATPRLENCEYLLIYPQSTTPPHSSNGTKQHHIVNLKRLAKTCQLRVPFSTRTVSELELGHRPCIREREANFPSFSLLPSFPQFTFVYAVASTSNDPTN